MHTRDQHFDWKADGVKFSYEDMCSACRMEKALDEVKKIKSEELSEEALKNIRKTSKQMRSINRHNY